MAFNSKALTKIANLQPLADDADTPGLFYYEGTDNLAATVTAGYFNDARERFAASSRIIAECSDGFRILKVTAPATGNVTVTALLGAVS